MSQDINGDGGGIDYSQLYVYAGPQEPDMSNMTIYSSDLFDFLDGQYLIEANIIGSSHYIAIPGVYHEITSCRPIAFGPPFDPVVRHYEIDTDPFVFEPDDTFTRHSLNGQYEISISLNTMEYSEIDPDRWDLVYTFEGDGPAAPTAIRVHDEGWNWRTVHAYPEFGVNIFTHTSWRER